jgi:peptidoglycan hydrolase-like protein with peptidoglycan-binding domain
MSSSGGSISVSQLATILAPSASTTAYLDSLNNHCPSGFVCTPNPNPATTTAIVPVFTRDLSLRSIGSDVKALQFFLNAHGYEIAKLGPGSPGHETTLFGSLTKKALMKFQKTNGIPNTGYFGPTTRGVINGME